MLTIWSAAVGRRAELAGDRRRVCALYSVLRRKMGWGSSPCTGSRRDRGSSRCSRSPTGRPRSRGPPGQTPRNRSRPSTCSAPPRRACSRRAALRLRVPEQRRAPEAAVRDVRASVRVGGSAGGSHTRAGEARAAALPGVAPRRGSAGGIRLPPAGGRRRAPPPPAAATPNDGAPAVWTASSAWRRSTARTRAPSAWSARTSSTRSASSAGWRSRWSVPRVEAFCRRCS